MIIRCTQKLIKELRIKPTEIDALNPMTSWHANVLRIDRRKCVLFIHDQSLFSVFVAGLKRSDFDRLDEVFGQAMFRTLRLFDFDQRQVEQLLDWGRHNSYTKTNSRSVLGSMNDMALHLQHHIAYEGGLSSVDLDGLHLRINQIFFSAIGSYYPWQKLKSLLNGDG
ncbi:MAG: hypothetical protein OQL27_04980 [Sedimenticola sp.]|nr:hypothetical protein [Sedimenticola sp.]